MHENGELPSAQHVQSKWALGLFHQEWPEMADNIFLNEHHQIIVRFAELKVNEIPE